MGELGSGLKPANYGTLPHVDKNFYTEHPNVERRSEEENERFRKDNSIVVRPAASPKPLFLGADAYPSHLLPIHSRSPAAVLSSPS